jgi:mRNA interferase HigB
MQIIALRTLRLFWEAHPQAEMPLRTWYAIAARALWTTPAEVKEQFGANVDFIADNRVIFDIGGNRYRLICRISYRYKALMVKFVGSHEEYDRIDPVTCEIRK